MPSLSIPFDTTLEKRSMRILKKRTSVALEPAFWVVLERLAKKKGLSLPAYIGELSERLPDSVNRSSALRVFILKSLEESL